MLTNRSEYLLCEIARELTALGYGGEEELLGLLREGKLAAHIWVNEIQINISTGYWKNRALSDFQLFEKDGAKSPIEYTIYPEDIARHYYMQISFFTEAASIKDASLVPDAIWKDVGFYLNMPQPKREDFDRWNELAQLRGYFIDEFRKDERAIPVFIGQNSWSSFVNDHVSASDMQAKTGRPEFEYWTDTLLHLVQCIVIKQGKQIHELLEIDRRLGRKEVARRLREWTKSKQTLSDRAVPSEKTYIEKLAGADKLNRDGISSPLLDSSEK